MTIAISGATGQLGRLVIEQLKIRTAPAGIVALARDPARAETLGVAARTAEYDRPETLETALAGVSTLLLISANELGKRVAQHRNAIAAAQKAGVERIVYTSVLRADTSPLSLAGEHRATEEILRASGLSFTILRNGWYTENYTASIPGALAGGAFIGSAGDGRISSATRRDFADAAALVLTTGGHDGRIYELAGDEAYTLTEFAAELSRQTGREIPYKNLPVAEYAAILEGFGLPKALAAGLASWDADAAQGAVFDDGKVLSKLLGRPTTPLADAIAAALDAASAPTAVE